MALSKLFAPKNGQGGVKKTQKKSSKSIFERWKKQILGQFEPYLQKVHF